ncbi:putative beta-lysine N-acetyltransferase [Desulfolucanica intricata]|uniref:putative beta-lysine N-acetyltransferase n=1 Tax=Desulfolucanica intricata TaxID=1285191 RepID=UPI0008367BAE|nr:putative beta-lysine N-acetyltransferase [Desulfolucanica intricata]
MIFAENQVELHKKNSDFDVEAVVDTINRRIWTLSYSFSNVQSFVRYLSEKALEYNMEKIIIPARAGDWHALAEQGWLNEGKIPHFFSGKPMAFYVKYIKNERQHNPYWPEEKKIIDTVVQKPLYNSFSLPPGFIVEKPQSGHISALSKVFSEVFETYPTPLSNEDYLRYIMKENAYFKIIVKEGEIVSIASAEIDWKYKNAEITNCATLPEYRGLGLMRTIIKKIEQDCLKMGLKSFYTLARSKSFGMNQVFSRLGYKYEGTLVNNCHICGDFEDMNLWSKAG